MRPKPRAEGAILPSFGTPCKSRKPTSRAHPEWYKKDWQDDGSKGPDGKPCASWDDFIAAISRPGSFAGDLELRALCKTYQNQGPCSFRRMPTSPLLRMARSGRPPLTVFFYTSNHFDYLAPTGDAYPKDLLSVVADPCGGFLVGGVSELATASESSVGRGTRAADLRTEPTESRLSSRRRAPTPQQSAKRSQSAKQPRRQSIQVPDSTALSWGKGTIGSAGDDDVDWTLCQLRPRISHPGPKRVNTPPADVAEMVRLKLFPV